MLNGEVARFNLNIKESIEALERGTGSEMANERKRNSEEMNAVEDFRKVALMPTLGEVPIAEIREIAYGVGDH